LSEELAAHASTRQREQIELILQCHAKGITVAKIKSSKKFGECRQAVAKLIGMLRQSMNFYSHSSKVRMSNVDREGAGLGPASRPRLTGLGDTRYTTKKHSALFVYREKGTL
jgi:hypothetical protein